MAAAIQEIAADTDQIRKIVEEVQRSSRAVVQLEQLTQNTADQELHAQPESLKEAVAD